MRLDSVGKPPLVVPEDLKAKARELKVSQVAPVGNPSGAGTSTSQNNGPKLGQILDILKKATQKKKPLSQKAALEAIRAYQKVAVQDEGDTPKGQTLDIRA